MVWCEEVLADVFVTCDFEVEVVEVLTGFFVAGVFGAGFFGAEAAIAAQDTARPRRFTPQNFARFRITFTPN